jgi:leader peptidase (prepilin peptidase)/N-methyltransferase
MEPAAARVLVDVASALFGLTIGSFLNVVVYRLPRGQSVVRPASRCPSCGTTLGALDNIPVVSWAVLRGKCRYCRAPISARYPAIELLTGAVFTCLALGLRGLAPLAPLDALAATTIAIGAIDLEDSVVPTVLGWIALGCSATLAAVAVAAGTPGRLAWAGIGAAVGLAAAGLDGVLAPPPNRRALPGTASCAAWGWCAGWVALGGGIATGGALVLLVLWSSHPPSGRRLPAGTLGAAATLGVLLGGAFATR